jgi:hypothetical protein
VDEPAARSGRRQAGQGAFVANPSMPERDRIPVLFVLPALDRCAKPEGNRPANLPKRHQGVNGRYLDLVQL